MCNVNLTCLYKLSRHRDVTCVPVTRRIRPDYAYNTAVVRAALFVLSVIHVVVTSCVLISYMIIHRPKGPGQHLNNMLDKCG